MATIVVCPNCGHHFDRPFMTEKKFGFGVTFGPLGDIKCPSCGHKAAWGAFKKEKDASPFVGEEGSSSGKTPPPNPAEEKEKSLDETKYDQS